ncbi:MAG: hypothetical protein PHZ02_07130 [Desulfocapsaceae bacterium]|nr:hypothetical protein [Desulfocapsaceae bacterium]
MIFIERHPVRGKIRRALRRLPAWFVGEAVPSMIPIAVMGVMIIMTMITIGELPSGPAADLSALHQGSPEPTSSLSFSTGLDPYMIANRADQGHFVGGVK